MNSPVTNMVTREVELAQQVEQLRGAVVRGTHRRRSGRAAHPRPGPGGARVARAGRPCPLPTTSGSWARHRPGGASAGRDGGRLGCRVRGSGCGGGGRGGRSRTTVAATTEPARRVTSTGAAPSGTPGRARRRDRHGRAPRPPPAGRRTRPDHRRPRGRQRLDPVPPVSHHDPPVNRGRGRRPETAFSMARPPAGVTSSISSASRPPTAASSRPTARRRARWPRVPAPSE